MEISRETAREKSIELNGEERKIPIEAKGKTARYAQ